MFERLSRDERLLLLKFVCAFAWSDMQLKDAERRFIERLMDRLQLSADDRAEVEHWLAIAPAPGDLDPSKVPEAHRRTFLEAARAVTYADGSVDDEEREQLDHLKQALGL